MDMLDERLILDSETYEDYLDLFVQPQDLFYLRDRRLARKIVALGYRTGVDVLTKKQFKARKDELSETCNRRSYILFSSDCRSTDFMLLELAARERPNRLGMMTTIISIRHRQSNGVEISGFIDYEESIRKSLSDFEEGYTNWINIFKETKTLRPTKNDLGYYNWKTGFAKMNDSINFKAIADPVRGLIFECRHDRQQIFIDPSGDVGSGSTRTVVKREVIIRRLNFQRIWTHPPPRDGIKVRGIDFRPDEKIIAIGYNTGLVILLDIGSQHEIYSFNLNSDITCFGWTQNNKEIEDHCYDDSPFASHETYLPQLPSFNSLSSGARKSENLSTKSNSKRILNLLVVGLTSGVIHTSVFGILPCGQIDVAAQIKIPSTQFQIVDAKMSADFKQVFVFVKLTSSLKIFIFENEIFPTYSLPLLNVAVKHGLILNTMVYIDDVIQSITEAWETALLEMDIKLAKYASSQEPGAVSADFLELLMFGEPSESLEAFLTGELTEKGLKKLGNSFDISYSTIQKLVVEPLHSGILNVCYHLNAVKGMSRNVYFYKSILGALSNEAVQNAGAFLIKAMELQQAIEQSTRDYKIFWAWLNSVIMRLMDEPVADDISAFSQQDIIYLTEFLSNFDIFDEEDADSEPMTRKKFNLERVGQYLENKSLEIESRNDISQEWNQLLTDNECLKNCELIYPHHKNLSLVQQHNLLKKGIAELFATPETLIGKEFRLKTEINCFDLLETSTVVTSHVNVEADNISLLATLIDKHQLMIIEFNPKLNTFGSVRLLFQPRPFIDINDKFSTFGTLKFHHMQFYNEEILSVLLDSQADARQMNCFIQFPVSALKSKFAFQRVGFAGNVMSTTPLTNCYDVLEPTSIRVIDGFDGYMIAVSGNRKVASILSESQKRIRLYEMEVEDEDEEMEPALDTSFT